jgi:hypothetical protein
MNSQDSKIIYVESCPICGDGLCRIRICISNQKVTGFVLCDECEAMWTDPFMQERVPTNSDETNPQCPSCGQSIWGQNSHWANIGEVCLLGWFDHVQMVDE